mmetsp:Transcript_4738/g.9383  ORF Transcript_4738/g.9383 Transcript_4738/m.9383 type:complete len:219 (+) Transcript_4738:85-741(+)
MVVKDGYQNVPEPETEAPATVNSTKHDTPPAACCTMPGGRAQGYAHEICECCCGEFNMSTFCLSAWCPCIVFYKTAEELNKRSAEMSREASVCTKTPMLAGILGAVEPICSVFGSGGSAAPAAGSALGVPAATVGSAASAGQCLSTVGTCVQVGLTCHVTEELKHVKGQHIQEDVCMTFCCALCCTSCRMTQVYHTLTDDDIGCGCCCHPRKSHAQMQ